MKRRRILLSGSNILYEAKNLVFDKDSNTEIFTGVYLFSADNYLKDFECRVIGIEGSPVNTGTLTLVSSRDPDNNVGFLIRPNGLSDHIYKGTISTPKTDQKANVIVRRINGVLSVTGDYITNQPVPFAPNAIYDKELVLGCALNSAGYAYRRASGTIDHIIVRWI